MTAVLADERFRGPTKPGRRTQAARRTRAMPIGLIPVDRSSPVPLYYQVARYLEAAIESGEMSPGSWLDNEVHLATELRLSRPTVRRAIQYLVDKGLVVRKRGVGTKVVHAQVKRPIELTSRYDDLSRTGQRPTMRVLANDIEAAAGPVAHALHLPEGTPVIALDRLRCAGGEPIARLRKIGARTANAAEAQLLNEAKGAPLLTMQRITYDDRGSVVEWGTHVYRASRYCFEQNLLAH